MTEARFTVAVRTDLGLFESAVIGFRTLDDVAAFHRAISAAAQDVLDATGRAPVSICDYTRAGTQSQEVADAMVAMMHNPRVRSRRVAMVTGSMLARIQARRILTERPEVRFFDTREEAMDWVLGA